MKVKECIQGKVVVKVQGTQLSRFLSLLLARKILYQNAGYQGDSLFLEIPAASYRVAVSCAKKAGVRIRIAGRRGLPFLCFRHRRRKWTLLFALPLLAALCLLPQFVWTIELEGLESISQMEMLQRLEKVGLRRGMWKSDVDVLAARNELLLAYSDLSWLSLSVDGTVLKVAAAEAVPAPEMVDRASPCDIVADQTCVVYSIVTESGTPAVQAGDVVKAGDVLIQGQVTLKDDDGSETAVAARAAGEIYGKRVWEAEAEIEKVYEQAVWNEKDYHGLLLRFGEKKLELRNPFVKWERAAQTEETVLRLPFWPEVCLSYLTYAPYETREAEYSREEMEQRLSERLEKQKAAFLADGGRVVLGEEVRFEETASGLKGVLELTVMEQIGKAENLDLTNQAEDSNIILDD